MMKTKYNLKGKFFKSTLAAGFLLFAASSCIQSDLLDSSDPMSIDQSKAWTSDYLTKQGMNGVYAALRLGMGATDRDYYQYDEWVTSMPSGGGSNSLLAGGSTASNGVFNDVWKDMYEAIFRCNDAITNIPVKSLCTPEVKLRYEAETRFLRAYFYSKLNMLYRGVPIYENVMTAENSKEARASEKDVWEFILKDLQFCIEGTKMPDKYAAGSADYGRATRGAAYALRGKVYMWTKEYDKAIADFDDTEKCGYALFTGEYKQLFKEKNEQSDEMIFSVQNIDRKKFGSSTQFYLGSRSTKGGTGWNSYVVQPEAVDLFETDNGEKFNWDDVLPGYSTMDITQREVFFLRNSEGIEDLLTANGFTGNIDTEATAIREAIQGRLKNLSSATQQLYLPGGNEERLKKVYAHRDPRLAANVITPYSEFLGYFGGVGNNLVTMRWPYRSEAPAGIRDLKTDTQSHLYYLHRKWVYEGDSEITDREYGPTDFPILRLADIVLLKAEAYAELNNLKEARTEMNRIRGRVGMPDITAGNAPSKEDVINRIRNERKVELFNEGQSLFDEFRWGIWGQFKFAGSTPGCSHIWGGMIKPYIAPEGNKTKYWAIPASEIEKNSALIQNDGW